MNFIDTVFLHSKNNEYKIITWTITDERVELRCVHKRGLHVDHSPNPVGGCHQAESQENNYKATESERPDLSENSRQGQSQRRHQQVEIK